MEMVVVLPAPFGPSKLKTSPVWMSNETPSTAVKSPNFLTKFWTSRIGGMVSPPYWIFGCVYDWVIGCLNDKYTLKLLDLQYIVLSIMVSFW
jgi:hypothetical protein